MTPLHLSRIGNHYDQYTLHDDSGKQLAILTDTTIRQREQLRLAPAMFDALMEILHYKSSSTNFLEFNKKVQNDSRLQSTINECIELYNTTYISDLPF